MPFKGSQNRRYICICIYMPSFGPKIWSHPEAGKKKHWKAREINRLDAINSGIAFDSQFTVKVQGVYALVINLISNHYIPLKFIDLMPSAQSSINPMNKVTGIWVLIFRWAPFINQSWNSIIWCSIITVLTKVLLINKCVKKAKLNELTAAARKTKGQTHKATNFLTASWLMAACWVNRPPIHNITP